MNQKPRLTLLWCGTILLALPLLVGIGLLGGVLLDRYVLVSVFPLNKPPTGAEPSMALIGEAWGKIQEVYVDRSALDAAKLTYGAISGMVDALGDTGHSRFLDPKTVAAEREQIQGSFEGVGIEVQIRQEQVIIVAPLDNSPAQRAGVQAGERILQVDGRDVAGLSLSDVSTLIRGPSGTTVTLTLVSPESGRARQVTLTRARVTIRNISWSAIEGSGIVHLRVGAFSQGVGADLKRALPEILRGKPTAIILDLRNNPGGLLNEAVEVASQFLKDGNVLLRKDAEGKIEPEPVLRGGLAAEIPLVVLINLGTASGSEITAGAIQDAHRGLLVGEKTFGTGTVLRQFSLSDGSAMLLAVEEWLTPNGRAIWKLGLEPDETAALPLNVAPVYPSSAQALTVEQIRALGDTQLLRAIELLSGDSRP
jgi:carboxyl-terminal processing protease